MGSQGLRVAAFWFCVCLCLLIRYVHDLFWLASVCVVFVCHSSRAVLQETLSTDPWP